MPDGIEAAALRIGAGTRAGGLVLGRGERREGGPNAFGELPSSYLGERLAAAPGVFRLLRSVARFEICFCLPSRCGIAPFGCMRRRVLDQNPQDVEGLLPVAEEREEVLRAENAISTLFGQSSSPCHCSRLGNLTSSIAKVSSLSNTRILQVSAKSSICVSSISMTFPMGSEILTLSPSLCDRKMTLWRLLTHSRALGALSALK